MRCENVQKEAAKREKFVPNAASSYVSQSYTHTLSISLPPSLSFSPSPFTACSPSQSLHPSTPTSPFASPCCLQLWQPARGSAMAELGTEG